MGENSKKAISTPTLRWPTDARTCASCEYVGLKFSQEPCFRCLGAPFNQPSRLARAETLIVGLRRARDSWRKKYRRASLEIDDVGLQVIAVDRELAVFGAEIERLRNSVLGLTRARDSWRRKAQALVERLIPGIGVEATGARGTAGRAERCREESHAQREAAVLEPGMPFDLGPNKFVSVKCFARAGDAIAWEIRSQRAIAVYVVDSENFDKVLHDDPWQWDAGHGKLRLHEDSYEVPNDDEWRVLIHNTGSESTPVVYDVWVE